MRVAAIIWCASIPGLQVYVFRRIRDDLVKNHVEGPQGFRAVLAGWVQAGLVTIVEDEIRFWNGSKIYLCHCKDAKDVYKYQGAEIHVLLIDELTHFTSDMYRFLRSRVRMVGISLPDQYKGKFPRILCGSNPGNIGHLWVKETFVTSSVPMTTWQTPANDGGMLRQFIPALLEDNPSMDTEEYEGKLSGMGSEALVRAMRYGDWDIIEGAFFDTWDRARHVVKPFPIPDHWLRFRSMDWGYAAPFSVGWWAVVSEPMTLDNVTLPRGCMVRYREWYGASGPNKGLRMTADDVAAGIVEKEEGERVSYGVLDPAAFAEDGGPSIAHRMSLKRCHFRAADNKRVTQRGAMGGWDQMRSRLNGDGDGNPMLVVFETCKDFIRTVPVLQHDSDKPEDLDTDMEDHAADEARYACMSRPWINSAPRARPRQDRYRQAMKRRETEAENWKTA